MTFCTLKWFNLHETIVWCTLGWGGGGSKKADYLSRAKNNLGNVSEDPDLNRMIKSDAEHKRSLHEIDGCIQTHMMYVKVRSILMIF